MTMLPEEAGIGSNGRRFSPKSDAEAAVEDEIMRRVHALLTADFLGSCVANRDNIRWFVAMAEQGRDRILGNKG